VAPPVAWRRLPDERHEERKSRTTNRVPSRKVFPLDLGETNATLLQLTHLAWSQQPLAWSSTIRCDRISDGSCTCADSASLPT